MKITVFQFNGCDKCFNETLKLSGSERIRNPNNWKEKHLDIAVITGYLLPENLETIEKIKKNTKSLIAYGSCAVTGGVYGLAYQKGQLIRPINKLINEVTEIHGCLGEIEELENAINGKEFQKKSKLCDTCNRKSTCDYLDEVVRSVDLEEDDEMCYNDMGFMCTGYIARECKELCVNSGAPCRGCKPFVDRPGFRMLGMFGTLIGNIEVATEATGKGGTDKLADEDDDVTDSFQDLTGSFFRFNLANTVLPMGRKTSTGVLLYDVFIGRTIEEVPMIIGLLGGSKAINLTIKAIEAYEKGNNLEVTEKTIELREKLLELEIQLNEAVRKEDSKTYDTISNEIRKIAGNMNLSNLFFGGFRTPIEGENYENYKYHIFDFEEDSFEGTYENGPIKYTLNPQGVITEFEMEV